METLTNQERELYEMARMRVRKQRDFFIHLVVYAIAIGIWASKKYFGLPLNFWPLHFLNDIVMSIWTLIVAIKVFKYVFSETVLGKQWEDKKVKEYMERYKENS